MPKPLLKGNRGQEYRGNPLATVDTHGRLAVSEARLAREGREYMDTDYIGHYKDKAYREGHLEAIGGLGFERMNTLVNVIATFVEAKEAYS